MIEKGTINGAVTNIDGRFSLSVPAQAIIQISYIGYLSQEIRIKNQPNIHIVLKEDSHLLDEVVVVGYGIQKKANVVGSISQVLSDQLESRPVPVLSNALGG